MGKELRGFVASVLAALLVFVVLVLAANAVAGAMTDSHSEYSPVLAHPTPDPHP